MKKACRSSNNEDGFFPFQTLHTHARAHTHLKFQCLGEGLAVLWQKLNHHVGCQLPILE